MASIALPRKMLIGGGTVKQAAKVLQEMGLSKPLIVSDNYLASNGTVAGLSNSLKEFHHGVFTDTIPDPTTDSVEKLKSEIKRGGYDSIVAIGGGSPMDSAKAAGVLAVHGGKMRDYKAPFQMDRPALPLICIPTTAGTGSEVTKFTIVSDSETEEKMLCIGLAYLPQAAIVDYELTMSLPKAMTGFVGVDAACHAFEAYVSAKRNTFSQGLALSSLNRISHNIRKVCENGNDRSAREAMMLASTEAGIAFSNASVTLIHGMSRPLGALFHVPHGLSNAMLAPRLTEFSLPGAVGLYGDVSRAMELCSTGCSDEDAAENFAKGLYSLSKDLHVPSLQSWGIDEDKFKSAIPKMAAAALASGSPNNNPVVPTQSQIEQLYLDVWNQGVAA